MSSLVQACRPLAKNLEPNVGLPSVLAVRRGLEEQTDFGRYFRWIFKLKSLVVHCLGNLSRSGTDFYRVIFYTVSG